MSEIIDLVDANGVIAKHGVERRDTTNEPGLFMPIIILVIFNGIDKVLVQQRSLLKKVAPGLIDHVCGAIRSGETPHDAATREAREETGIALRYVKLIRKGINAYHKYAYLFAAHCDENPRPESINTREVSWVGFKQLNELLSISASEHDQYVEGFFDDLKEALSYRELLDQQFGDDR